jgi:hypothetical protein
MMSSTVQPFPVSIPPHATCFFEHAEQFLQNLLFLTKDRQRTESLTDDIILTHQGSRHTASQTLDKAVALPVLQRRVHAAMLMHSDLVEAANRLSISLH